MGSPPKSTSASRLDTVGGHPDAPALLRLLDKAVRSDIAHSGLQGRILFGVETAERTWWWRCAFRDNKAEPGFEESAPADCHATMILGDRRACAYMGTEPEGTSNLLVMRGNRPLLDRFLNRYLLPCSPLQARLRFQSA